MRAYEMLQRQKHMTPKNPYIGQYYYEPYMRNLRIWTGKKWLETSGTEINEKSKEYGTAKAWMLKEYPKG